MKKLIIPSIIANSQKELNERIKKIESEFYHLDIMDGKFVKNKSLWFSWILTRGRKYEAHLMVKNPEIWITKNWKKVDTIIFHLESGENPEEMIKLIRSKRKKVGIAINPKTSVEKVKPFLNKISIVLVMAVNPGKYGSRFLPKALEKVKDLKKLNKKIDIEVDGGMNLENIRKASKTGANRFAVGSYLQNSENPKKAFEELRRILKT